MAYVITCESTADLSAEKLAALDVHYIPFHYSLGGEQHFDDLYQTIGVDEFYQAMVNGAETKTSAIGVGEYTSFFQDFLERGFDVIHVSLSSGISATVDSARIAAADMAKSFPMRKITVIDSLAASSGFGLLLDTMAEKRDEGVGFDELVAWVEANKKRVNHWFFSTDLTFFIKGGRVKPAAGYVGNLLGICPLLNVDFEGKLIPREKCRSKKKAYKRSVEKMAELATGREGYEGKVFISNSACLEDATAVADLITERFPKMNGPVEHFNIGTTIGSHTGPGTVALFFWGDERVD